MHEPALRTFVDPRTDPTPSQRIPATSTPDHASVAELARLCREGRIYAIEAWIMSGKPLYATTLITRGRAHESALKIAIDSRQYDLALLLLCNGFPADPPGERLLSSALSEKRVFVELLLTWGADPRGVDAYDVLDTYDSALYDRFFLEFGVDFTKDHALAFELARKSSNRPAYGWAKRHKDDPRVARELAMALCDAVDEDRERAVALLLWAGADPHTRVPNLRWWKEGQEDDPESDESAVMTTIRSGKGKYLARLKPDPAIDDLALLWRSVHDVETLDVLARIAPPADWSRPILGALHRLSWGFRDSADVRRSLERMFATHGAKLDRTEGNELTELRRCLLRAINDSEVLAVLRLLSKPEHCEPAIYAEIMRTPSMQRKFGGRGLRQPLAR